MPAEIRRIAGFLGIDIDEARWPAIVGHCTFEYMKKTGDKLSAPVNDLGKYETIISSRLTPDCAHWLATGQSAGSG
jgi:aryl sulfotransferase